VAEPVVLLRLLRRGPPDRVLRRQSSALVDGRLLLELGHDGVRAATDLTGVQAVLVTHGHPDHHAVPAWMWRGWAAGTGR
jgi:L-ascorbate metabolism protein UlaG (beta-lactamase superfamily)